METEEPERLSEMERRTKKTKPAGRTAAGETPDECGAGEGSGTVILANGAFPRKGGLPRRLLESAARVVCCDGAADAYRKHTGKEPFAVVGDLDSVKGSFANTVEIPSQETNDLEKAARWCRDNGLGTPVVVGAFGKREDHSIGNVFKALDLGLEIVSECGRFVPVEGTRRIRTWKGAPVSVFAPDPETRMSSSGLEWPLDGVRFRNIHCAVLNRATSDEAVFSANRRVSVFIGIEKRRSIV